MNDHSTWERLLGPHSGLGLCNLDFGSPGFQQGEGTGKIKEQASGLGVGSLRGSVSKQASGILSLPLQPICRNVPSQEVSQRFSASQALRAAVPFVILSNPGVMSKPSRYFLRGFKKLLHEILTPYLLSCKIPIFHKRGFLKSRVRLVESVD